MDSGKIRLFILMSLLGCLASCVKDPQDIPSGIESNPVFGLHGSFGNQPVSIDAGIDGWTMIPVVVEDSLNVYASIFSHNGCLEQCTPSWSFRFFEALPAGANPANSFQNTIHEGEKQFVLSDEELDSFEISLSTHPGLFMSGYSFWLDNNGGPATTFEHEFNTIVGHDQDINVCFQSQAFTGCQYSQCIYFDPSTQVPCLASIEPIWENSRYISLNLKLEGTPPFQIQWFNEETTSSIVIPLQDSTTEIYAGVSVMDGLGNRTDLHQTIRIQGGYVDACYFPIKLTSTPIQNTSTAAFQDRVEIVYRDEDGVEWRSSSGIQPQGSHLQINEVTPYNELSPTGQTTYLTEIEVSCLLYNPLSGESRVFTTQELVLALSHN